MSKNKSKNNNNGPDTIVLILVGLPGKKNKTCQYNFKAIIFTSPLSSSKYQL